MAESGGKRVRRGSRMRRRRRRAAALLLLVLLMAAAVFAIVFFFFRIGAIEVVNGGAEEYTEAQIAAASGLSEGENIFSFNKADVEARLMEALPYVGGVTVERRIPDRVVIRVSETTDYAAVPYRGGYLIISAELRILSDSFVIPEDIPVIYGVTPVNFTIGSTFAAEDEAAGDNIRRILEQLDLYDWFAMVPAINVRDHLGLSMIFDGRIFAEFGTAGRLDYKFEMFYEVVTNQYDGALTGYIDLSRSGQARVREGDMPVPNGYFDIGA